MPNLGIIFATGLLTGGVTCMAVQGGLLASTIAARENKLSGTTGFLGAKFVSHIILGFLLGWLGSVIKINPITQALLMAAAATYMIGIGLAMLDVHPYFRYFLIQTPRFLNRFIRKQSKREDLFAPVVLGLFTIFIPCGTTQAMMALAVASGSPVWGAAILGAFVLGTSPLFLALGVAVTKMGDVLKENFRKVAAYLVVIMAIWNLNSALVLAGSPVTGQKIVKGVECTISICDETTGQAPADVVTVRFTSSGYNVDNQVIKAGSTVTLKLQNQNAGGCIQAFVMPKMGIQKVVPMGQTETITFKAPSQPGELSFSCSMGMYGGTLRVI